MSRVTISKKKVKSSSISKNVIRLSPVRHARTFLQRFMGLMGVRNEELNYALVFYLAESGTLNASIHMLFMKTPIDVVWLDETKRVVDRVEGLKPWVLNYTPKESSKFIVEMPVGWIRSLSIRTGDRVEW